MNFNEKPLKEKKESSKYRINLNDYNRREKRNALKDHPDESIKALTGI